MKTPTETIESDFDKMYPPMTPPDAIDIHRSGLKNHIHSIRQSDLADVKAYVEGKKFTKEHICRFNDGQQNCDCYNEALDDILTYLTSKEKDI